MNKVVDAKEVLHEALNRLDELGLHSAAAHVSMAISLLYDGPCSELRRPKAQRRAKEPHRIPGANITAEINPTTAEADNVQLPRMVPEWPIKRGLERKSLAKLAEAFE